MAKKRFIAGATCPSCNKADTMRWWQEHHVEVVECVSCGHTDRRSPKSVAEEQPAAQTMDTQVIGIFKPE